MNNETFPAGYIERTVIEPVAIWMPQKKVVEEKDLPKPIPSTFSMVAEKVVQYTPWVFAGISLGAFLLVIGITGRKR